MNYQNKFYISNLQHRIKKDIKQLPQQTQDNILLFVDKITLLPPSIINDYQDISLNYTYDYGEVKLNFSTKNMSQAIHSLKEQNINTLFFRDKNNYAWKIRICFIKEDIY